MTLPVRPLPTVQKWDCRGCSDCCRTYSVGVSEAERGAEPPTPTGYRPKRSTQKRQQKRE